MLDEAPRKIGLARAGAHRDRVDRRELESRGQRPDQHDARRVPDLGDLRAADAAGRRRAGKLAHCRRAVRKGMEPRRDGIVDAELAQHLHEMDAGRGELRIGEIERRGRGERVARSAGPSAIGGQSARPCARRCRCARGRAARRSPARTCPCGFERVDERRGQDDRVARRACEELVAHRADGAERASHDRAGGQAKLLCDRTDDSLRGAAGKKLSARPRARGNVTGRPSLRRSSRCAPT